MEIPGNKPSLLGEILNSAASSIYFTERARRGGYFHHISTLYILLFSY